LFDTDVEDTIDGKRWKKFLVNGNQIIGKNMPIQDTRFLRYLRRFKRVHGRGPKPNEVVLEIKGQSLDDVWQIPGVEFNDILKDEVVDGIIKKTIEAVEQARKVGKNPSEREVKSLLSDSLIDDVWDMKAIDPKDKEERLGYPTQKPVALIKRLLEITTDKGDVVLDCFGGGGTTAKACSDLDRRFIVGDVSPVAVKIMAERMYFDCPDTKFELKNLPKTTAGFKKIAGHKFAEMVCDLMGWKVNEKKSGDGGIDAWNGVGDPVQIKNHAVATGRPDIQKFFGALAIEKSKKGMFVARDFSRAAIEYIAELKRTQGVEIDQPGVFVPLLEFSFV
jgi:hypothetical protein